MAMTINNVVSGDKLKEIQIDVLNQLSEYLSKSFGPYGSTTCIKKLNALNVYTKDGHNILTNIIFNGVIEQSIKDDVESITRHVVKTVGDGTTSSVILSNLIFKAFVDIINDLNISPAVFLRTFHSVIDGIVNHIGSNAKPCTVDDIYDIAMISSNGDEKISANLRDIYKDYGMGVFIDVNISNTMEDKIKVYDGLTLNAGFADPCYINSSEQNVADLRDVSIYVFDNPIDTPELGILLDGIITSNILEPITSGDYTKLVSTVVICPRISRDMSALLDRLMDQFAQSGPAERPPFVIVTGYSDTATLDDISRLCGVPYIRRYIDPENYKHDIEEGKAPTPQTVSTWCGYADQVVVSSDKVKFVNPSLMYDDDGNESQEYKSLVDFLEKELAVSEEDGEHAGKVGLLKRRLQALKSNLVEYLVGGITVADRDSARDLIEDAVKNTRSAALNGVGRAANFEAASAIYNIRNNDSEPLYNTILNILYKAYVELITELYTVSGVDSATTMKSIEELKPINLRDTGSDGSEVLSSIESDMVILKAVSEIIGIMFTTNQFIVPTPAHNVYSVMK